MRLFCSVPRCQVVLFSHSGVPIQVCMLKILEDEELLKWSIANLALQVFLRSGGPAAQGSANRGEVFDHRNQSVTQDEVGR